MMRTILARRLCARSLLSLAACALLGAGAQAQAQAGQDPAVLARAEQHKAPLLDTLKDLCNIESGSRDLERSIARPAPPGRGRATSTGRGRSAGISRPISRRSAP